MSGFARQHNIGASISAARASDNVAVTAGGAGDNTAVTGQTVDRAALQFPLSCSLLIGAKAVLAAGKSLFLKTVKIQHGNASDGSDAVDFAVLEDATGHAMLTSAGGGTVRGVKKYDVDLAGANRYIRAVYTPDMDATNTDTSELAATFVLGGEDTGPAV